MSRFSLASLLRVRGIQEDRAAAQLARAQTGARSVQRRAQDERELLETLGGQAVLSAAGIARASAAHQLAEIRAAQQVADGEVEAAEQALMLARRARRSAELLRDRHEERMRALADRADQHQLDELAASQFARRQAASPAGADAAGSPAPAAADNPDAPAGDDRIGTENQPSGTPSADHRGSPEGEH